MVAPVVQVFRARPAVTIIRVVVGDAAIAPSSNLDCLQGHDRDVKRDVRLG